MGRNWRRRGSVQYFGLWATAVTLVGLAFADITIRIGSGVLTPITLTILATIAAALTTAYKLPSSCH